MKTLLLFLLMSTASASIIDSGPPLGQDTMANSIPVTLSSDQSVIGVTQSGNWNLQYNSINSAGSQVTGNVSTVITLTAPSNAIGFTLEAKDANTANIRWAIGATATTAVGQQLQPGRDTGYVPAGVSVSIVSESGTQEYQIQWVLTH